MICPIFKTTTDKRRWNELVKAVGEPIAYLVNHRANGEIISMMDRKSNPIFDQLVKFTKGDRNLAIQYLARQYSSNFTQPKVEVTKTESKEKPKVSKPTRSGKFKRGNISTITKLSEQSQDLIDENGIDYNNLSINSFMLLEDLQQENNIVNSLVSATLKHIDELAVQGKTANMTQAQALVLEDLNQEYEFYQYFSENDITSEDIEDGAYDTKESNAIIAENIKQIIDNFNQIKEGDKIKFVGFGFRITHAIGNLKYNVLEEVEEEDDTLLEKTFFSDAFAFKVDPEKSLSAQVKKMLSFIPKTNATGETTSNSLGYEVYEDYNKVFNLLSQELAEVPLKDMYSTLEELSKTNNIAKGVLKELELAKVKNTDAYNKFFVVFRKQDAKHKLLRTYPRDANGKLSFQVIDANRSGAANIIMDMWHENFKVKGLESGLLKQDPTTGQITINTSKGTEINKRFDDIIEKDYKNAVVELSQLLNEIGINVSEKDLKKLNDQRQGKKQKYNKYFAPHKTFKEFMREELTYVFGTLTGKIAESTEESWQVANPFYSQSKRISGLAAYYMENNPDITSASHRNANGDMVFSYVMPSHLSNRIQKIKRDEAYVASLKTIPFIKNSTWLTQEVDMFYFDASKNAKSYQDAINFQEQNPIDKEYTKIGLFQKYGKKAVFFGNTPSDKGTLPLFETDRHIIDLGFDVFDNGEISVESIDLESKTINATFDLLVQSEINRINAVVKQFNEKDIDDLIPGYHYLTDSKTKEIIPGGGNYFFFIPELNDIAQKYRNKEGLLVLGKAGNQEFKQILANKLVKLSKDKVQSWNEKGIVNIEKGTNSFDKSYSNKLSNDARPENKGNNIINMAATDFVVNYMMSYANQFMVVTGDPALFTKPTYKFNDWKSLVANTSDNIFKRTAKDIAPGLEGNFEDKTFTTVFLNEPKGNSILMEYTDRLGKLGSIFNNMDIADAQEWTTVSEHLNNLYAFGKIDKPTRDSLLDKIEKRSKATKEDKGKYNLTWAEIRTVLQPMKPVYVTSTIDEALNTDVHYYVKTSSYPLLPQLTEGMEIDKLREAMELNNINRAVVPTGVKTGYRKSVNIFDGNKVTIGEDFTKGIQVLERDGFRIQQEVPNDPTKDHILEGSQLRKLKFANLTPDLLFNLKGADYRGHELKKLDDAIHNKLYSDRFGKLLKQLGVEESTLTIEDVTKLRDLLRETAKTLGYGYGDLMLLNTLTLQSGKVAFEVPLYFQNSADKLESMLNSIVKNRVLKNKMSGLSFVQGSSAGFTPQVAGEEFLKEMLSSTSKGIAYTKHWAGEQLDYREYEENGKKVIYGEVFAPFRFLEKLSNGTKVPLKLEDYIDSSGFIKEDKIDDALLNMLGYRIPTQGHNSMLKLKIVGFLPQEAGDLIIVPGAITKQMGADFDVDKLYTHFYNYTSKNGVLTKIDGDITNGIDKLTEEELHNLSLDITYSILANETVQNKYQFQPIDSPALADDKKLIKSMRVGKQVEVNRTKPQDSSILYDEFQTHMVDVNAAGKVGIGSYSSASTNHILFQYAGVHLTVPLSKKNKPMYDRAVSVMFKDKDGNIYTDKKSGEDYETNRVNDINEIKYDYTPLEGAWRLDKVFTFPNAKGVKKTISEVISYFQSASVDNAKDQHLYDLHQNKETFRVTSFIARAGFDEVIINRFINQPIVVEYVKRLTNASTFTENEFNPYKTEEIQKELFQGLGIKEQPTLSALSIEEMEQAIKDNGKDKSVQARVLINFIKYAEVSSEVSKLQTALNTDTAYLGKSLYSSINKLSKTPGIAEYTNLGNINNLIEGTTQGGAIGFGLEASVDLFSGNNLFPIKSDVVNEIFEQIELELGKTIDEKLAFTLMNDIRAGLFSEAIQEVFQQDIDSVRTDLLYGTEKEPSLAVQLHTLQQTSTNPFINALSATVSYDKKDPDVIEFSASKDIKAELDLNMLIGWNQLLTAPVGSIERNIGEKLVLYSLAIGNQRNARDFGRFLPYDYIVSSGLSKYYRSLDFTDFSEGIMYNLVSNFTTQWYQHNPFRATQVQLTDMGNATDFEGKKVTSTKQIPDVFNLKSSEESGMSSLYRTTDGETISNNFMLLVGEDKSLNLYKKEGDHYLRIPTLGNKAKLIKEFNFSNSIQQTIFGVKVKEVKSKKVEVRKTETITTSKGEKIFEVYNFKQGKEAVLDKIIANSSNELNVAVAKYYKKNIKIVEGYLLEAFNAQKHNVGNKPTGNLRGRTNGTKGSEWIAINPDTNETFERFEEAILHELTHAFLNSKIVAKHSPDLKKVMDTFLENYRDKLTDVEWLSQIGVENFNENGWEHKNHTFSNEAEFASFIMSNSDFQKILSNTQYEGDKSFMQKIKELILKILGVDIKTDSKLAEGLSTIINIIEDNNNPIEQQFKETSEKVPEGTGETTFDLIDGHRFPDVKPVNKYVKSALADKDPISGKTVYVSEISQSKNKKFIVNNFFRYAGKDKQPFYPFTTGTPQGDIALKNKINNYFNGDKVVYYKGSEGVIRFTTKTDESILTSEVEEELRRLEQPIAEQKSKDLDNTIKSWSDTQDLYDPDKLSNVEELITRQEKGIRHLKSKLTEKNVNRSDLKAKITALEKNVEFLKEQHSDVRVEEVIKETLKSVNNELTNTRAELDTNPSIDNLWKIIKRLGEIDLYIEGIRDVDNLLYSENENTKKEYAILAAEANQARKEYLEQTRDAITQIAQKVSYAGLTKEGLFGATEDINFFTRAATGLADSKSELVRFIDDMIHNMEHNITNDQVTIAGLIDKNVEGLEKHTGLKGDKLWDLFLQKYEDGTWTGNYISKYKQEFYDKRNQMYLDAKESKISWRSYFSWLRENSYNITEEDLRTGKSNNFSKEAMDVQKEYLSHYEADKKSYLESIQGDPEELRLQKENNWIETNSPYIYANQVNGKIGYVPGRQGYNYLINAKPIEKWQDRRFDKIKNDKVLMGFYTFMESTFQENNKYLPYTERLPSNYLPEASKTFMETVKNESVLKGIVRLGPEFTRALTEEVQGVIDYDIEIGGRKYKSVSTQMMFNKLTANDKSRDIGKVLKLHSAMSNAYRYKTKVEPLLNAAQQQLDEMAEISTRKTLKGDVITKDRWGNKKKKEGKLINTKIQLEHAVESFLYGNYREVEGRIDKVILSKEDKAKIAELDAKLKAEEITKEKYDAKIATIGRQITATGISDTLNKYTYLNALGFPNAITPMVNLTFGIASNFIYASGNEDTNLQDMRKAMRMFTSATVDGKQLHKIWAFMETMGVLDDFNESLYGKKKTLGDKMLYFQTKTEQINRGTLMLAILLNKKLLNKAGNEVSLYDAFKEENGKLVWDVDKMGEQEQVSEQEIYTKHGVNIYRLKRLVERTAQYVHGDYESALEGKRTIAGRTVMMFKTWMPMSIINRFGRERFDDQLQRNVKGRYTVLFNAKDAEGNELGISKTLKLIGSAAFKKNGLAGLSELDRASVRKNLKELQFMVQFTIAILALSSIDMDDEEDKFAANMMINFLTKAQADLAFFTNPSAMSQVVNNVAPVYTTVKNIFGVSDVAWKMISGNAEYKSGPNKGKNRALIWAGKITPGASGGLRMLNYGDKVINYF